MNIPVYNPLPVVRPELKRGGNGTYGEHRRARLTETSSRRARAYVLDVFLAVGIPAGVGVVLAASSVAVLQNVSGAQKWIAENVYNEQVTSALGTMVAFLVTSQLGANLSRNAALIGHFGNLSGACVNMAMWSGSLVTQGELAYVTLPDGYGRSFTTTEVGLILSTVPYVVKYENRGNKVRFGDLPISGSPALLKRVEQLTTRTDGLATVSGFTALVMLLAERFDAYEANGLIKPPELGLFFSQLNALTAEEGSIGGAVSYAPPFILSVLLYGVFLIYYGLLVISDLGPTNEWNATWIVAVLITANYGIFSVSQRYSNPFKVRTGNSTQRPLVSVTCRETERAIEGVFARRLTARPPLRGLAFPIPTAAR
ncbi:MAG: hypothetical protein ACKVI4_13830 [Actinomycetales bacterium]